MTLRVAHVSGFCHGGASAMVRLHDGLRAAGVQSRIHCRQDVGSIRHAKTLKRRRLGLLCKARRRILGDQAKSWRKRIDRASRNNSAYEMFSPPIAIAPVQMDETLQDIDLLHLHWCGGFFDFQDFFSQVEVPVVWTLHDQNPYLGGFHYQADVDNSTAMLDLEHECRSIKRDALRGLNLAVAANSDWNRDLAMTTGVLPQDTLVERLYLPLPLEDYTPLPKVVAKQQLNIDPNQFVVGFASASMENRRKGLADLIAALRCLPASIQKHTTLISFGREPSETARSAACVPWRHLGPLSGGAQQSAAYSSMDLFVIPSIEEAFGQTPLEALACRTPVVGTRVGGIPETVIDGRTGRLASPGRPDELAICIERLYADARQRESFADAGRLLAEDRHSTDHVVKQHLELYRRVLERHQRTDANPKAESRRVA